MSLGLKKFGKLHKNKKCELLHISKIDLVYLINQNPDNNENIKMDNLKKRRKRLVIFIIIIILSLCSIILFGTLCSDDVCALSSISLNRKKLFSEHHINRHNNNLNNNNNSNNSSSSFNNKYSHSHLLSYDDVLNDDFQNKFDINSNDVMVIIAIIFFIHNTTAYKEFL